MPTLYEYERNLDKKTAELEVLVRKRLAAATAENEKAERKLREEHEAMFAPYSPSAPPARDEAGRYTAPAASSAEQFAANKAAMQAGLRASG
jgi:hypothetical protein